MIRLSHFLSRETLIGPSISLDYSNRFRLNVYPSDYYLPPQGKFKKRKNLFEYESSIKTDHRAGDKRIKNISVDFYKNLKNSKSLLATFL